MKRIILSIGSALLGGATVLLAGDVVAPVASRASTSVSFAKAININSPVLYPTSLAAGDLNGDGFADLAVVGDEDLALLHALGKGDGHFGHWSHTGGTGDAPNFVLFADVDLDGNLDAITTDDTQSFVAVAFGNGKRTFSRGKALHTDVDVATNQVAVADLNGDGIPDFVGTALSAGNDPGRIFVLLGAGDRKFEKAMHFSSGGYVASNLAVGDLNHDGIPDLVVANTGDSGSGGYNVSVLLGRGDGTFEKPMAYKAGGEPYRPVLGDFNGDGNLDIAVVSIGSNQVYVLLGNGDGTFSSPKSYQAGIAPHAIAAADFNGDGKLDLVVLAANVTVLLGNGDGTFQPPLKVHAYGHPNNLIVADFNHDGKPDIATIETVHFSSFISILLNTTQFPAPPPHRH